MIANASRRPALPLGLTVCLLLAACGGGGGDDDGPATTPASVPAAPATVAADTGNGSDDDPDGTTSPAVEFGGGVPGRGTATNPGPNFEFAVGDSFASADGITDGQIALVEDFYGDVLAPLNALEGLLPRTVPVGYERCGFANAFFDTVAATVTLCDELMQFVYERFAFPDAGEGRERDEAVQLAFLTMAFTLYHEIGHVLDQELDLPLLGNIESGADSIAAVLSVETGNSVYAVLGAALFLDQPASFADLHGGGEDRAGDLICWALGGDGRLALDEASLPFVNEFVAAGRDCTAEYAEQRRIVLDALPGFGALPRARPAPVVASLVPLSRDR